DDDDDVIAALIAGARVHVEAQTRCALITQTWQLTRDSWPPDGRLRGLPAPLNEIGAVRVRDADGVADSVDLQAFTIDRAACQGALPSRPGRCRRPEKWSPASRSRSK